MVGRRKGGYADLGASTQRDFDTVADGARVFGSTSLVGLLRMTATPAWCCST